MGATVSAGADNDELVDNLLEADYIKTAAVERVFRAVDRGHYFTVECKDNAYKDLAWKYGNLHISAPCIYSEVMENLKLAPGMSFLNLGSGTGYLSTMAGLILGSYGINHGVEIHEDVLNYAKKKLEEFCLTSPALDEYEFCQPKFINGNCLHLGSEARQYDRVYCGAACPENHENYMKNLIKVGGILVMPINDQLLQIYRISDTNWETKSVLPVSFASLICSNVPSGTEPLKMPDADPMSLQDICRFAVRSILRRKIDMEHPELKKKPSRVPRKRVKKKTLPKFMIPIFGGHSDREDNDVETEELSEIGEYGPYVLMDVHSVRSRTLLELSHLLAGPSRTSGNEEEGEDGAEGMDEDGDGSMVEREDEQMSDAEMNCSKAVVTAEEVAGKESPAGKRLSDAADTLVTQRNKAKDGKREKFDSGIVEDIEKGCSSDSDDPDCERSARKEPRQGGESLFEDSDAEIGDAAANRTDEAGAAGEPDAKENVRNYSTYMREKIKMLPLPLTLKYFVNFDREL
ncbi:UNVERIFIED_CONTAM: hypothetical protein PYX00_005729 [Menopon gallinae]|uniref:Protein-L-isoaspartate O-methyltransferase domain-containing protein 2 n=1 Tax=Menopon gallinae TaxID=328185 RepID=A0AAW2HSF8_9NEOP